MKNEQKKINVVSAYRENDGTIYEMIYDPAAPKTEFVTVKDGEIQRFDELEFNGQIYAPFQPDNNFLKSKTILFPSDITEYGSDKELITDIRSFIHKYVGITEFFEEIASYYVLFTYIYDCFQELPYLRALADYGCGKSRFLKTIGSLCYKPMFTAGATSVSPIFRIIDTFKGTFVLDEADLKFSDTKSEIVKILNSGFSKGTPVLRSEENKGKGYDVKTFDVYCPKIIATRERFYDKALESRFLIEELDSSNMREDIPHNLPDSFEEEATHIRNKLLMWRFNNYGPKVIDVSQIDKSLEPRLNQIILPLMSIISDPELKERLKVFIKGHNSQLIQDRGFTLEADVLGAIMKIINQDYSEITMNHIKEVVNAELGEREKQITAKRVGMLVREKLKLRPRKTRDGYVIDVSECIDKLNRLCAKYDINQSEDVNDANIANVVGGAPQHDSMEILASDIPW